MQNSFDLHFPKPSKCLTFLRNVFLGLQYSHFGTALKLHRTGICEDGSVDKLLTSQA